MHQDSTAGYACGITSASAALLVKASAVLPSSRDFSAVLEDVSLGGTGEVDAAGVAGACLSTSTDVVSGDWLSALTACATFLLSAGEDELGLCDTPA